MIASVSELSQDATTVLGITISEALVLFQFANPLINEIRANICYNYNTS